MDFSLNANDLEIEKSEYLALLRLFASHAKDDLAAIETALMSADLEAVYQAAHSIKGASGSLNLLDIQETAQRICAFARDGVAEPIAAQAAIIVRDLDTLSQELSAEKEGE